VTGDLVTFMDSPQFDELAGSLGVLADDYPDDDWAAS
jgi:hypothetical protein